MSFKLSFAHLAFLGLGAIGAVACSANTSSDESPSEPDSAVQDSELRKSITSCNADDDCVAVPRGGCCQNGWFEAVNKHHTQAYENATKCTQNPRPMCPMYLVHDTRVAQCDATARQCKMVASSTASIDGNWGADQATMVIANGKANLEFGCGAATIDSFVFSSATQFTGTGTHTAGTGVQPPPGMEPKPQPATFKGTISGTLNDTITLKMTTGGYTSTFTFTAGRGVMLIRCL